MISAWPTLPLETALAVRHVTKPMRAWLRTAISAASRDGGGGGLPQRFDVVLRKTDSLITFEPSPVRLVWAVLTPASAGFGPHWRQIESPDQPPRWAHSHRARGVTHNRLAAGEVIAAVYFPSYRARSDAAPSVTLHLTEPVCVLVSDVAGAVGADLGAVMARVQERRDLLAVARDAVLEGRAGAAQKPAAEALGSSWSLHLALCELERRRG